MRARVNPFREPTFVAAEPNGAVRAFHRSLPGYRPTPLEQCPGIASALGLGQVLIKDESHRFGLNAFKALGASWALDRIRKQRFGTFTVSTATEGNHGRAVAWAARLGGLPAVVFLPAGAAAARIEPIRREGARIELVEGSYDDAVRRCAELSAANDWQVVADTGYAGYMEIPHWIAEGYATLFDEVVEQSGAGTRAPDLVIIQAGVGGLLHAAVNHFRRGNQGPMLAAVEPVEADGLITSIESPDGAPTPSRGRQDSIMAGLDCGEVSLSAWPAIRRGVDIFFTITDQFAEDAMRRLARPASGDPRIEAGESGAASLAGLLALLNAPELAQARRTINPGPGTRVLLINTEGATDPVGYRRVMAGDPR